MLNVNQNEIVILSIKPEYIKLILTGEKQYEFRKRIPKIETNYFLIHESKPTSTLKYLFIMDHPIKYPEQLPGDSYGVQKFNDGNSDYQYAYKIKEIYEITNFVDFSFLKDNFDYVPPQNFSYLSSNLKLKKFFNTFVFKKIKG